MRNNGTVMYFDTEVLSICSWSFILCVFCVTDKVRGLESEILSARLPASERMESTLVAACASKPSSAIMSQMDESNDSGLEDDDNLKGQ